MHDVAPITSADNDELEIAGNEKLSRANIEKSKQQVAAKWASMWRAIVLSSMGKTLFPYSKYIRTIRLQDLEYLLQDGKFMEKIST